jgi:hypothetical protein
MTIVPRLLAALLLGVFALQAGELRVCLEDRTGIGAPTRAGMVRELNALLPDLDLDVAERGCSPVAGADILLSLVDERPGVPPDALGLAHSERGLILPRLEVLVGAVLRLTKASDRQALGRALARVAAHELLHYQRQSGDHDAHGLMQARLAPSDLLSEELRPRLMASLYHD